MRLKKYTVRIIRVERRDMTMTMRATSEADARQLVRLQRYVLKEHPFRRTMTEVVKIRRAA